jgi:hypothetical protein
VSVLNKLKTSGSLPLNQLNLLSRGSPEDLRGELQGLIDQKLVKVSGGALPAAEAIPSMEATLSLTRAGLQESLG